MLHDDLVQAPSALLPGPPDQTLPQTELERVLACRDSLLHSLRRQLDLATAVGDLAQLNLSALAAEPVRPLRKVLAAIPNAGPDRAPTDVLIGRSDDTLVESWRQVARASLLATDVLDSTRVWRTKPDVEWAVVTDAAAAAASLSVLDDDLAQLVAPIDADLARRLCQTNSSGLGLAAALVQQVASTGPVSATLPRLSRPEPTTARPRAVGRLGDAAEGQQRLAEMLRRRQGGLPARSLGPVLIGQARIANVLASAPASWSH